MSIKYLKDHELHDQLLGSIQKEKQLLTEILHLMREVDERKLYCDFQCKNLFEYSTKVLNYSEAEAYTRINAMRLIREIPDVEADLASGALSLTNASQARTFFRKQEVKKGETRAPLQKRVSLDDDGTHNSSSVDSQTECGLIESGPTKSKAELSKEQKIQVLKSLHHLPSRKAKALLRHEDQPDDQMDRVKNLPDGGVELRCRLSQDGYQKLLELNLLVSSNNQSLQVEKLVHYLCDRQQEKAFAPRKLRGKVKSVTPARRRLVFERDGGSCRNCGSKAFLEIDHIQPQALGGDHDPSNLQTLCRPCNQRRAIKTFGLTSVKGHRQQNPF